MEWGEEQRAGGCSIWLEHGCKDENEFIDLQDGEEERDWIDCEEDI